ncbi:MAG: hypothetical protein HXX17_02260 [Geobacteraceae bacterium]|nr:hypothetical protein [Geobacteraceae bacterium]
MSKKTGILAVAALLTLFAGISIAETVQSPAQGKGPASMMRQRGELADPDNRLKLIRERLGLSDEQAAKIKPILVAEQAEIEKLRGNSSLNRDQRRAKLEDLNKGTSEKIRQELTEEQQKKYDAIKTKITETRSKTRGVTPGTQPMDFTPEKRLTRLTERLTLTKEQQDLIKPILESEYTKLKELPANDTFNRDQRRAKLQEITGETNAKIMPLLTPEQQTKYKLARDTIIDRRSQKKRSTEKQ